MKDGKPTSGFWELMFSPKAELPTPWCFIVLPSTLSGLPLGVAAPGRWSLEPPPELYRFSMFWTPGVLSMLEMGLRPVYWSPARTTIIQQLLKCSSASRILLAMPPTKITLRLCTRTAFPTFSEKDIECDTKRLQEMLV